MEKCPVFLVLREAAHLVQAQFHPTEAMGYVVVSCSIVHKETLVVEDREQQRLAFLILW